MCKINVFPAYEQILLKIINHMNLEMRMSRLFSPPTKGAGGDYWSSFST